MTLCFSAALMGVFSNTAALAAGVQREVVRIETVDEQAEGKALEEAASCGKLIRLSPGQAEQGAHLSIHGLGASPKDMAPLTQRAADQGKATATFAYNDMHCSHEENSKALASELKTWLAEHPGQRISIETHSLGGRTLMGAFHLMQQAGEMPSHSIQLSMVSPPLAGFGLFNIALPMPPALARLIPGAAATRDMASLSKAQGQLDQLRLPSNVQTKIFYGDDDNLIDYTTYGSQKIAENLGAEVYYLAGEGHYTTVPAVARGRLEDFSKTALDYQPAVRARAHEHGG